MCCCRCSCGGCSRRWTDFTQQEWTEMMEAYRKYVLREGQDDEVQANELYRDYFMKKAKFFDAVDKATGYR